MLLAIILILLNLISNLKSFEFDDDDSPATYNQQPESQQLPSYQPPQTKRHHFGLPKFSQLYSESSNAHFMNAYAPSGHHHHSAPPPHFNHRIGHFHPHPRSNPYFSHITNRDKSTEFNQYLTRMFNPPSRDLPLNYMRHLIQPSSFFPVESRSNYVNEMFTGNNNKGSNQLNHEPYSVHDDEPQPLPLYSQHPEEDMETSASEYIEPNLMEPPPSYGHSPSYGMADFIENYSQWPSFMNRGFDAYPVATDELENELKRHRVNLRDFGGRKGGRYQHQAGFRYHQLMGMLKK